MESAVSSGGSAISSSKIVKKNGCRDDRNWESQRFKGKLAEIKVLVNTKQRLKEQNLKWKNNSNVFPARHTEIGSLVTNKASHQRHFTFVLHRYNGWNLVQQGG